jgi:hypothetical protein
MRWTEVERTGLGLHHWIGETEPAIRFFLVDWSPRHRIPPDRERENLRDLQVRTQDDLPVKHGLAGWKN